MSGYDDDRRDMTGGLDFSTGGGGTGVGSGAAVARFVDDLRGLGDLEPPPPSGALAAVLAGAAPPPRVRRRSAGRIVAAVAACAVLGGAGTAAAHGRLPQPAQRVVSDMVDTLTPFQVPAHSDDDSTDEIVPRQPVRRPLVGPPPGAGRRTDDARAPARAGTPSARHERPTDGAPRTRPARSGSGDTKRDGPAAGVSGTAAQPTERESSGDYGVPVGQPTVGESEPATSGGRDAGPSNRGPSDERRAPGLQPSSGETQPREGGERGGSDN